MASPLYDALSVQHSKNVGDPVAAAATNGSIWTSAQRDNHFNLAIRQWVDMRFRRAMALEDSGRDASEQWNALRMILNEEAVALGSNVKTLSSWTGGVSHILSVYNDTLSVPVKPYPLSSNRFWTGTGGNQFLAPSSTNQYWLEDASTIRVLGSGASDTIRLRYLKDHAAVSAGSGSEVLAVPDAYYNEILDLTVAKAMEEFPSQENLARYQMKLAVVQNAIGSDK